LKVKLTMALNTAHLSEQIQAWEETQFTAIEFDGCVEHIF
jgi:hypothetical protein